MGSSEKVLFKGRTGLGGALTVTLTRRQRNSVRGLYRNARICGLSRDDAGTAARLHATALWFDLNQRREAIARFRQIKAQAEALELVRQMLD